MTNFSIPKFTEKYILGPSIHFVLVKC